MSPTQAEADADDFYKGYKENIRDGHSPSAPHYHFPTAEGMAALEEEIKRKKESNVI